MSIFDSISNMKASAMAQQQIPARPMPPVKARPLVEPSVMPVGKAPPVKARPLPVQEPAPVQSAPSCVECYRMLKEHLAKNPKAKKAYNSLGKRRKNAKFMICPKCRKESRVHGADAQFRLSPISPDIMGADGIIEEYLKENDECDGDDCCDECVRGKARIWEIALIALSIVAAYYILNAKKTKAAAA